MSFHFYLCHAADNAGPMSHWEKMEARPIGDQDRIKQELSRLYPQIHWQKSSGGGWSGLGDSEPYIDILLHEYEPGKVRFIVLNKSAPSTMCRIMEHFDLNTVSALEADDLVDPYAYDDTDRHYGDEGMEQALIECFFKPHLQQRDAPATGAHRTDSRTKNRAGDMTKPVRSRRSSSNGG